MGIINILDTEVSNKIAAGEVVERPASVIKELVENSIDAGATNISVEIRNGGVTYMRVSDNGKGMNAEDAGICFLRHATSKIKDENDLDAIYTLGFRGEALSSIGAVAQVSLYTKQADTETGICVTCRGGEILSSEEAGIPDGTCIIVENLFYNTPARLKFLKKDATEAGYITDIITRFIFAHPEISFRLTINGKDKLFSPGDNNLKNSVYTAYGKDYAKGMLDVDYETDGIHVTGLTGKGTVTRPNRNYQSYFVNRRYIKSALVIRAVEDAYKNQIMIGKFPAAVLNIEIEPSLMDINVHPTKLEVKFANERAVRNAVYYAVKNALYALPNVPEISRVDEETGEVFFERDKNKGQVDLMSLADNLPKEASERPKNQSAHKPKNTGYFNDSIKPQKIEQPKVMSVMNDSALSPEELVRNAGGAVITNSVPIEQEMTQEIQPPQIKEAEPAKIQESGIQEKNTVPIDVAEPTAEKTEHEEKNVFIDEYFEIVGQIFDTYIIVEKDDKMLLVDQHAAHERLKYEELKRDMAQKKVMSQMLIEPVIVKMDSTEIAVFADIKDTLYNMGFECDEFGGNEVIVRGAPGEIESGEVEELLLELVTNAAASKNEIISAKYERLMYTIACKAAIKANHKLGKIEMEVLVRNVLRLKNINTCPHGRPIIITMSRKEIEKEFKRIV